MNEASAASPAAPDNGYRAFISYSHRDLKAAKWLQRALERYRVPRACVGRETALGKVPRRLKPIFRDTDELPGASDLTPEIERALDRSQSLIVICSPHARESVWVNREISYFKSTRGNDRLLCVLASGEPNATDSDAPEQEAFPETVRFRVDRDGVLTDQPMDPLAGDLRPGASKRRAKVLIVSGLTGLGFDDLWRRDVRRRRRTASAGAVMAAITVVAASSGLLYLRSGALSAAAREATGAESVELATQAVATWDRPEAEQSLRDALPGFRERVRIVHSAGIDSADYHRPTGRAITLNHEGRLMLWSSPASGAPPTELAPGGDLVQARFNETGSHIVGVTGSDEVRAWDAEAGTLVGRFNVGGGVVHAAVSPSGEVVATAHRDGAVVLWESSTGNELSRLEGHREAVLHAAFSPSGDQLVTTSMDGSARLWDMAAGVATVVDSLGSTVVHAAYDDAGDRVAISSLQRATVFDASTGEMLAQTPEQADWIVWSAFSPDGELLVTLSDERDTPQATVWRVDGGLRPIGFLTGHSDRIVSARFSPDGTTILTTGGDGTSRVWLDPRQQPNAGLATLEALDRVVLADFVTERPGHVVTIGRDSIIALREWRADGHEIVIVGAVRSVAFDGPSDHLITGGEDGSVRAWDTRTGELVASLEGHTRRVVATAVDPDQNLLATGSYDGTARIWDLAACLHGAASERPPCEARTTIGDGASRVVAVDFAATGERIATGDADGRVMVWDVASGSLVDTVHALGDQVTHLAFGPHGRRLAAASPNLAISWEPGGGPALALPRPDGWVESLAFSPDGRAIVAALGRSGTLLWDAASGDSLLAIEHSDAVFSAVFSPDGRSIATGNADAVTEVWDLDAGQRVATLEEPRGTVDWVGYTPDGEWLLTSIADGTARLWTAEGQRRALLSGGRRLDLEVPALLQETPSQHRVVLSGDGNVVALLNGVSLIVRLYVLPLPSLTQVADSLLANFVEFRY